MIDKKTYKLLKRLYRVNSLDCESVGKITGYTDPHRRDFCVEFLLGERLIKCVNAEPDEDGYCNLVGYEITLHGRAFVETRRKQLWGFVLPYAITTLIAVMSLATTIAANWDKILAFLQLSQSSGT